MNTFCTHGSNQTHFGFMTIHIIVFWTRKRTIMPLVRKWKWLWILDGYMLQWVMKTLRGLAVILKHKMSWQEKMFFMPPWMKE